MIRRGALLAFAAGLVFASSAGAEGPRRMGMRPGAGTANPSALIAAEIAFARAAREKGQWTAFADFADENAVMFVPQPVLAREWLKGRANPAQPVQWQPYEVWMSCDGTIGATRGAWQRADGSVGYFTTVWQQRGKGDYRWVLDQGDALDKPLEQPEMLSAVVADCPARREGQRPEGAPLPRRAGDLPGGKLREAGSAGGGTSDDGTLDWRWKAAPAGGRTLTVALRKGGSMAEVLSVSVAGEAK